jgi:hypothetical protein
MHAPVSLAATQQPRAASVLSNGKMNAETHKHYQTTSSLYTVASEMEIP